MWISHKNPLLEVPVLSACMGMRLFTTSVAAVLWNTEGVLLPWGVQEQLEAAGIWGVGTISWLPSFNYPWALSHFRNQVTGLERPFGLTQCCCLDVNADNDSLTLILSGPRGHIEGKTASQPVVFLQMLSFSETQSCKLITTAPTLKNGESSALLMS